MTPILQVENLTKSFGSLILFSEINFSISENQRVGLIARNGTGKSTLLKIVAGLDTPDSGNVVWRNDITVGYLDQNPFLDPELSILDNVFKGDSEAIKAINRYEQALISCDKNELQAATELMDAANAWDMETKAQQILMQLNITDIKQKVDTLSGGQQKRVALASTLISEPDFLILDEPTNHLDLNMVEWIEGYLASTKTTILMVTHDRQFLDSICTDIMEIDEKQIYWYSGNYSYFLKKREERVEARQANVERATNTFLRELEWMRQTPMARTGKAKYRIDAFYKLRDEASQRFDEKNINIKVGAARLGKKILEVIGLHKSFGDLKILDNFSYNFRRYERLGIVGSNGTGKTTFLNIITENIKPDKGKIETGETVVFGYFRQVGISFDEKSRVIDAVRDIAEVVKLGDGKVLSVSQFLTMFLFPPSVQNSFIHKLSGGEKRRLYLCTVLMRNPNFLILDEPTNDLDIQTLTILEEYLESFAGVVLAVSHDRRFLDKVVDGLLIFEGNGEISGFPGNYSDYYEWSREQQKQEEAKARQIQKETIKRQEKTSQKPQKMSYAEKKELENLTVEIDELENEKRQLETEINSSTDNYETLTAKSERIGDIIKLLDEKSDRWLKLCEKAESINKVQ